MFMTAAEILLHAAIHSVLRKLKLSAGDGFKAGEALKQPCALSVSNAHTYLINSTHFASTFFHLLHMDGCSTVDQMALMPRSVQVRVLEGKKKTLAWFCGACIFNKKHFLFKAVGTLCCWQIRLCFPSPLLIKCGFFSLALSVSGWKIFSTTATERNRAEGGEDRHKSLSLYYHLESGDGQLPGSFN